MEEREQISLTGKKGFKIKSGSNAYKTWEERMAEMEEIRRRIYPDMFGDSEEKKEQEQQTPLKNN